MRFRTLLELQGSPDEIRTARRFLRELDFDFGLLQAGLTKRNLTVLTVAFRQPKLGPQFWGQAVGSVATAFINPRIAPYDQQRTLGHELGHLTDALWLNPARRKEIHALFHAEPLEPWAGPIGGVQDPAYLGYASEGFAIAFGKVFAGTSSASQSRFTHRLRKSDYEMFRGIVLRPRKVGEPEPPPVTDDPPPTEPEPPDPLDPVRAHLDSIVAEAEAALALMEAA